MASRMFENLNAIVANTLTDSIKMIDIDELHESKDNFFQVDRIEEFADTILGQGGVKDNLVVRPLESGGYEIISGHRRRAAVRLLLDRGENISRLLPCLVQNYTDEDTKLLDIVLMNISARQISDAEMWKSYEIVDRILKSKKSAGEKFGRIREKLAEYLGVSASQVSKMQNVDKNAIEPVKNAVSNGEISISTANEIARLSEDEQEEIMQSDLDKISHKEIKKKNDDKKVATYSNFSEDNPKVSDEDNEKIDDDVFSEDDDSEPDSTTKKVATYGNFSEDNPKVSDEDDEKIDDNVFSEDDDSEPDSTTKKVATYGNFSEDNPKVADEDDEKIDDDVFSEDDDSEPNSATKKVATYGNFSEGNLKVSNEHDDPERIKDDTYSTFSKFIYDKYYDIEEIIEDCMETYYDEKDEEYKTLQEMLTMLHQIKEDFRKKIRLGL